MTTPENLQDLAKVAYSHYNPAKWELASLKRLPEIIARAYVHVEAREIGSVTLPDWYTDDLYPLLVTEIEKLVIHNRCWLSLGT